MKTKQFPEGVAIYRRLDGQFIIADGVNEEARLWSGRHGFVHPDSDFHQLITSCHAETFETLEDVEAALDRVNFD